MESGTAFVTTVDRHLRVGFADSHVAGVEPDALPGTYFPELLHPDDRADAEHALREVFASGRPARFDIRDRCAPSGCFRLAAILVPGGAAVALAAARLVGGRGALDALREPDHRYRHLWESLNDAAFLVDVESGLLLDLNPTAERLIGRPREQLAGQPQTVLYPPGQREHYARLFRHPCGPLGMLQDVDVQCADGSVMPVDISVTATELGGRQVALGLFRDVSRRRHQAEELRRHAYALERANRELQQLLYLIAHDLKAPLRAISHLSTALAEEGNGRPAGSLLAKLRGRAMRMHAMLDALLAYADIGVGGRNEPVLLEALVRDAAARLRLPADFALETDGCEAVVETDAAQLGQVLTHLIDNAVQHHDRGAGRIAVFCRAAEGGWEIAVSDDGPGIPPAFHGRIFEMFQTLSARARRETTGAGLALVKKLVESRGGRVGVESGAGRGATFRFLWPT